jgi:hypothetical protein
MMNVSDPDRAVIRTVSGLYEDGWAEGRFTCSVAAHDRVDACVIALWLKPEPGRTHSLFKIRINGGDRARYQVRHDARTLVHLPCSISPGQEATLEINCDNDVIEKNNDDRPLSFKLDMLRFS